MHPSKKSSALRARRSNPPTDGDDRSHRLAALTLTFSMAALLAACGGAADSNPPASEQGEGAQGAAPAAAVLGATATRAQALAIESWVPCGSEGDICSVPGTKVVRYGANGTYLYKTVRLYNTPQIAGAIFKVNHLVRVTEAAE